MQELPSQPVKDSQTSFSLFNWLRQLFNWAKPISKVITVSEAETPSSIEISGSAIFTQPAYFTASDTYYTTGDINVLVGNIEFFGTQQRILGDFSNATISNRLIFQSNTTNGNTLIPVLPNGAATVSGQNFYNTSDPQNAGFIQISALSTETRVYSGQNGSGANQPLNFYTGGAKRVEVSTTGNVSLSTGNLTFGTTGQRILGDFSNGTTSSRTSFQDKTTNSNTIVQAIPNGTATISGILAFSGSDADNSGYAEITGRSTEVRIGSNKTGTGTAQPIKFYSNGILAATVSTAATPVWDFVTTPTVGGVAIGGGKLKSQEYTSGSGNWTWPAGVDLCWVTLTGGGGGGAGTRNSTISCGGGGGAGETIFRMPFPRAGATTTSYFVGTGGGGGAAGFSGSNGSNGTASTFGFGNLAAAGGEGGQYSTTSTRGGTGGGTRGVADASNVVGANGVPEGLISITGSNGGGANTGNVGKAGGSCDRIAGGVGGTGNGGGGGGGSSFWAKGGTGSVGSAAGPPATPATPGYGAGGGGAGGVTSSTGGTGGSGGGGYILIEWIE